MGSFCVVVVSYCGRLLCGGGGVLWCGGGGGLLWGGIYVMR